MAIAQRDEGLDRLEAFIAMLDAAHDRLEEGAERLDAAAAGLEEHEDELDDLARAITHGGEGALAAAMLVVGAVAGLEGDSESDDDVIVSRVEALSECAATLQTFVAEVVIGDAAPRLQAAEKEELERLAANMGRCQQLLEDLQGELQALEERLVTMQEREKELEGSVCVKVAMIGLALVLTVIAAVAAIFNVDATLALFTVVAVVVVACVAAVIQAMVVLVENMPVLLRAAGFDQSADDMAEWMGENQWFKCACMALMIVAAVVSLTTPMAAAATVAAAVTVLSLPLMIAMAVVENVARLLSALNPFE